MNGCWVTMKKRENPSYPHTLKLMLYPVSSLEKNNHQKYTRRYLYIFTKSHKTKTDFTKQGIVSLLNQKYIYGNIGNLTPQDNIQRGKKTNSVTTSFVHIGQTKRNLFSQFKIGI